LTHPALTHSAAAPKRAQRTASSFDDSVINTPEKRGGGTSKAKEREFSPVNARTLHVGTRTVEVLFIKRGGSAKRGNCAL